MTTFELELEQGKSEKIAQVAARGASIAPQLGQQPGAASTFLSHYFRHVDAMDVDERSVDDLLGLVESHYRLALHRPAARATVAVRSPSQSQDGWTAGGATVVQIVTDDRPFLVDSVTMEVIRHGWSIREVFHPQFLVRRDVGGTLRGIVRANEAGKDAETFSESWMHLEILPPSRPEHPETLLSDLEHGLLEVLRLVEEVVQDWSRMRTRSAETIAMLPAAAVSDGRQDEAALATELLEWLNDNHFTFLGYRQYRLVHEDHASRFEPVPSTGLGILRADTDRAGAFHALPRPGNSPELMIITKDNEKSRVHRPAYLDYIGIRTFSADGEVSGERRFLGLFASSAYSESVPRIPVLRQKAAEVLRRSGYAPSSHGGKAIMDVLDTYPRDELFQASIDELAPVVEKVAHLKERRQVRLFVRREPYGRYLSCLVYLPRDRYTTAVRKRMEELLLRRLGGASIDYTARVSESVLARLHFVVRMPMGQSLGKVDVRALERELTLATRSWDDEFADVLATWPTPLVGTTPDELSTLVGALPEGYKEDFSARQGMQDLAALMALPSDSFPEAGEVNPARRNMVMYVPDRTDDEADLRLKIFRWDTPISLSQILPHLSLLGVDVIDERPYELMLGGDQRAFIYDFGITVPGGRAAVGSRWPMAARQKFMDAFSASYAGLSEPDRFHALVMGADLSWQQVTVLRAIGRYLRQTGTTYSQTYLASALSSNVDLARQLVTLFETRFDPGRDLDTETRKARATELTDKIKIALNDVASLDHDRILRSYLAVIAAMVRTNAYQPGRPTLAFKLLPRQIPELPEPRPAFEIFVYSPRIEGVHLRFGAVARGGLRWSDRAEDFRREVLGLVKAQMVKNTVIVPVGAKGGFYAKQLPDPGVDREAWLNEGKTCYSLFITSLLDVTDNLVAGEVVAPPDVIRYDPDDPYLVVAADKGTATFSDIANSIAVSSGFWLGDAFASGGSAGYDHKAMGITARGAWESVRRHFREMGVDCQTEDVTCVGIGDMSGDVFGNGMLLSEHLKLLAAFDHRHVFLDPTPDASISWQERARLFALPRSSWADYDPALISDGGGVFPRTAKSIQITPAMHKALGIPSAVESLTPAGLINACLKAPVDLLWNGGIGTYVKATNETHAEVGDKANDVLRVDGCELRARCVGEGGNLGFTQRGRVEYAARGGSINTDFIDNSAGVDTSDHEVNIKILLSSEMAAGRLSRKERDAFLASMTDEVADLVLAHNYDQNLAMANSVYQSAPMAGVHEDWMERLSHSGFLDRNLEALPSTEEMDIRRSKNRGLTSPELATLMAYTKIVLEDEILGSDLPDDPYLIDRLITYFPTAMRERYAAAMPAHRLHREIIATVVVNQFVDASGITCFHRLSGETGASASDIIRAQIAARAIFNADEHDRAIRDLDYRVDAQMQTILRMEVRTLVERATRWLINNHARPLDISTAVKQMTSGVHQVQRALPTLLQGRDHDAYDKRLQSYRSGGVPDDLATVTAALPPAYAALTIVHTADQEGRDPVSVAEVHFTVGQRLGLDRLLSRMVELPRDDRWQTMARAALRDDLQVAHAHLTAEVLNGDGGNGARGLVAAWERQNPSVPEAVKTLRSICAGRPDLARMSVGLRIVRGLLSNPIR
ncbi:MAG TPA: NAD-glutamate dehydrogenase [Propionibacteriaceae bacterium]|nr:NAD-glutamate dehydrogenase [Propionibacteriaceae bacterium]